MLLKHTISKVIYATKKLVEMYGKAGEIPHISVATL